MVAKKGKIQGIFDLWDYRYRRDKKSRKLKVKPVSKIR